MNGGGELKSPPKQLLKVKEITMLNLDFSDVVGSAHIGIQIDYTNIDNLELDSMAKEADEAEQEIIGSMAILSLATAKLDAAATALQAIQWNKENSQPVNPGTVAYFQAMATGVYSGTGVEWNQNENMSACEAFSDSMLVDGSEGFKESLGQFWEWIKKTAKKLWKNLKKFASRVGGKLVRQKRSLEGLKDRAAKALGKNAEENKVEITSSVGAFYVDGNKVTIAEAIAVNTATGSLLSTVVDYGSAKGFMKRVKEFGLELERAIEAASPEKIDIFLDAIRATTVPVMVGAKSAGFNEVRNVTNAKVLKRFAVGAAVSGVQLLGNVSLYCATSTAGTGSSPTEVRNHISRAYTIGETQEKTKDLPGSVSSPLVDPTAVTEFATSAINAIENLISYHESKALDEIETVQERIAKSVDKFTKDAKKDDELYRGENIAKFNTVPTVVTKYNEWVTSPVMGLESNYLMGVAGIASACSKCLSLYK